MRTFWIILGIVVAGAVVLVLLSRPEAREPAFAPQQIVVSAPLVTTPDRPPLDEAPAPGEPAAPAASPQPAAVDEAPAQTPEELAAELLASAELRVAEPDEAVVEDVAPRDDTTAAGGAGDVAEVAADIAVQDDGSQLVDGRFTLRGEGTSSDPYRVTWEQLIAAAETYEPREGRLEIPDFVRMLDGRHVRLTGYLAFPLATQQVDEALVMLNQWDGCCLGVPPSPYDGVEVRLSTSMDLQAGHFFRYGTVEGVFKVDPYLVNDWLVGLYLIEEASIETGL